MNTDFIFWAQPLDNTSPDIVYRFGRAISSDFAEDRQEAVSEFTEVVRRGSLVTEINGLRIIITDKKFFVEVPCEQRDEVNRIAPVVCSGPLGNLGEGFGSIVAENIQEFAKSINRTVTSENLQLLQDGFSDLRKKTSRKKFWARWRSPGSYCWHGGFYLSNKKSAAKLLEEMTFPSEPSHRRAILLVNDATHKQLQYDHDCSELLYDEELQIVQLPNLADRKLPLPLQNIKDAGLARPGLLLVQSPYDLDIYEDALVAPHAFALAKHIHFSTLCRLLGAREVKVEQVDIKSSMSSDSLSIKGGRPLVASGELDIQAEEIEKTKRQLQLHDEFPGGAPDIAKAEKLLRSKNLWSDQIMRSLIDQRRESSNQIKSRTLTLSLSSESTRNLKVAARLKVPAYVDLSADYLRVVKQQHDYTVTVIVRF